MRGLIIATILALLAYAGGGCDGASDGDGDGDADSDVDSDADSDVDSDADGDADGDVDGDGDGDADGDSGGCAPEWECCTAVDVRLDMHHNEVKIDLHTMTVLGAEATEYDLYMDHGTMPFMRLAPGASAQSLGNETDYHDVTEAPVDGYEFDDDGAGTYVIGTSWQDGGSGHTGFEMTENVYVVLLADGTYAKIEILSAMSGEIHVLCYHQCNGGTDLTTNAE